MNHLSSYTLDLYLDNELMARERVAVEAHLDKCAQCRSRVAGFRELFVALDTLQPERIPVDLAPQVLARLAPRAWPLRQMVAGAAILAVQAGIAAWLVLWLGSGSGDWVAQTLSIVPGTQAQGSPSPLSVLRPSLDSLLAGTQVWLGNLANGGAGLFERIDPVQWWVAIVVAAILWLAGNRLFMVPTGWRVPSLRGKDGDTGKGEEAR